MFIGFFRKSILSQIDKNNYGKYFTASRNDDDANHIECVPSTPNQICCNRRSTLSCLMPFSPHTSSDSHALSLFLKNGCCSRDHHLSISSLLMLLIWLMSRLCSENDSLPNLMIALFRSAYFRWIYRYVNCMLSTHWLHAFQHDKNLCQLDPQWTKWFEETKKINAEKIHQIPNGI